MIPEMKAKCADMKFEATSIQMRWFKWVPCLPFRLSS